MHTVNIGILAHVDAGKTSLTERLLFDTGVIDRLGSVDSGTTQTDTGDIERRRGITIRSAVAAFPVGDRQVNLIDTPGHSDFVAEVERALGVLDGAVLVMSAVEGVQPHTRALMKTLRALRLPTLIFINKIDRVGARSDDLLADIARLLTPAVVPMGTVRDIGTPGAAFDRYGGVDVATDAWAPVLAEHDDGLLAPLVDGEAPDQQRMTVALGSQTAAGDVYPLLFGSALSGAGVPALLDAIGTLLPPSPPPEPELRARVFAIERGTGGEKIAYVRSYGGDLRTRQHVTVYRRDGEGRLGTYRSHVTGVSVVGLPRTSSAHLTAGFIAKVRGMANARIGDQIGSSPDALDVRAHFAPPTLETTVRPAGTARPQELHAALMQLADEDPLIRTHVTPEGETAVALYGEVQKEVIGATLADAYGIAATFEPSRVVHTERPIGTGAGLELISHDFLATVGLRVDPGRGVDYRLEVELGSMPLSFHRAVEETVRHALAQGIYGWPVTDIRVTLTRNGFKPETAPGHFRQLVPFVLMQALAMAGTRVYEPCHHFELDVPPERLGPVVAKLAHVGAKVDTTVDRGAYWRVTGDIPARVAYVFQQQLPGLSNGEGLWSSIPYGDRAVLGSPPRRARTDGNPFDRVEYMRFLAQRDLATTGR
jgi:ribosomal protection tetracycline resistance protein